ncbi:LexA family protein [Desulfolucanica intricata]|uniref:LexA family protein n=1 Tax=Desulfolucanica intricata TaxID=1285191 RepID=UPI0009EE83C3
MQVFQAIKEYKNIHSYSPSVRELGKILGVPSPGSVYHHLDRLKQMGYITSEPNKARSIRIIRKTKNP